MFKKDEVETIEQDVFVQCTICLSKGKFSQTFEIEKQFKLARTFLCLVNLMVYTFSSCNSEGVNCTLEHVNCNSECVNCKTGN